MATEEDTDVMEEVAHDGAREGRNEMEMLFEIIKSSFNLWSGTKKKELPVRNYQWRITDVVSGRTVWNRTWNNADGGTASCGLTRAPTTTWKCTYANVPAGKLEPGRTYTWEVAASDGSLGSGYTNISTFTVSPDQNLLEEKASFASPLNDANVHTYDIAYAPATGVMTVQRDGVAVGTYTDPQPLAQGSFVMPMSNLVRADFDNLIVSAQPPANAPPVRSVYYSHPDHLGSSSVVTDSSGEITQQLDYLPYGEERINEQTPPAAGTGQFDTKKKYTGKELDAETGLYYYGARYYDSRISRFISLDPAGINLSDIRSFTNPQGWNLYSYGLNNPVRYNDPSGMAAISFGKALGGLAWPLTIYDEIANNSTQAGESIPQGWKFGQSGWQCTSPPCGSWPTDEEGSSGKTQEETSDVAQSKIQQEFQPLPPDVAGPPKPIPPQSLSLGLVGTAGEGNLFQEKIKPSKGWQNGRIEFNPAKGNKGVASTPNLRQLV